MTIKTPSKIWYNGEIVPWEQATVHVMAHGLHYGSSVFEGIRVYSTHLGPAAFRLGDHICRMFNSAKIYRMEMPYSSEAIGTASRQIVAENDLTSAYVRPIAFRGLGSMGVPPADNPVSVAIAAFEWGAYLGEDGIEAGIDVVVSSWRRTAPNTIPTLAKAGGAYLSSQLIVMEANHLGYAEGIALDANNMVSEGSGENIFLVKGGRIITPPIWTSILPGITRDTVMTLAARLGLEVVEEPVPRESLYIADELFFTGTAAEITPIRSVDGIEVGDGRPGDVTRSLQTAFFGLFDGSTSDENGWLEPIDAVRSVDKPEPALCQASG
jgi:branched-chain amino acid aminotransferase